MTRNPAPLGERVTVLVPPDIAYAAVADVTRMGQWSPEVRGARVLGGPGPVRVGTRFGGAQPRLLAALGHPLHGGLRPAGKLLRLQGQLPGRRPVPVDVPLQGGTRRMRDHGGVARPALTGRRPTPHRRQPGGHRRAPSPRTQPRDDAGDTGRASGALEGVVDARGCGGVRTGVQGVVEAGVGASGPGFRAVVEAGMWGRPGPGSGPWLRRGCGGVRAGVQVGGEAGVRALGPGVGGEAGVRASGGG